jgi:hypothetical protein
MGQPRKGGQRQEGPILKTAGGQVSNFLGYLTHELSSTLLHDSVTHC